MAYKKNPNNSVDVALKSFYICRSSALKCHIFSSGTIVVPFTRFSIMHCGDTHALQWRRRCQLPTSHSDVLECASSVVPDREGGTVWEGGCSVRKRQVGEKARKLWFRAQQSPEPVHKSQIVSSNGLAVKWQSVNITQQYIKSKFYCRVLDVKHTVVCCSLVSKGQQGHMCKMKGEAAVGCFHRGMERSGSGPSTNTRLIVQVQGNSEWGFHSVIPAPPS